MANESKSTHWNLPQPPSSPIAKSTTRGKKYRSLDTKSQMDQLPPQVGSIPPNTTPRQQNQKHSDSSHKHSHNRSKSGKQRNAKRHCAKDLFKQLCVILFLLLIGSFTLELVKVKFGAKTNISLLITGGVAVLWTIIKTAMEAPNATDTKNLDFGARIISGLVQIWLNIRKNSSRFAVFVIALYVVISVGLAKVHAVGHLGVIVHHAFVSIAPPSNDEVSTYSDQSETHGIPSSEPIPEENSDSFEEHTDSISTKNLLLLDPTRTRVLTDGEKAELYFLSGEYKIENWWDDTAVADAVLRDAESLTHEKKTNLFVNASKQEKDKANEASKREEKLQTSAELDEIKEDREEIYDKYPMYDLAVLIAEDNARFGLAYDEGTHNLDTTEYYYGKTIHWYREALRFNPRKSDKEHLLRFIGHRYHDIAACLPLNSDNQRHAAALSAAYYDAADNIYAQRR